MVGLPASSILNIIRYCQFYIYGYCSRDTIYFRLKASAKANNRYRLFWLVINETRKIFYQNHVLTITPTNLQNWSSEKVLITKNNVQ